MDFRAIRAALGLVLLLHFSPPSPAAASGPGDFAARSLTVEVLRADGAPVPGALVRAVSDDWGWRHPRESWEWLSTGTDGRVTFTVLDGAWTIVAGGDVAFGSDHPGHALFLAQRGAAIASDTVLTLRADRETACTFRAIDGSPLWIDEVRATLADRTPGGMSVPAGWSESGSLVLETSAATGDAALACVRRADTGAPAYILGGTAAPGGTLLLAPSPGTVSTFRFEAFDAGGAPTDGNVEIRPLTFDGNNFVWDVGVPAARTLHTNMPAVRINHRFIREGEYFYFVGELRELAPGSDTTIAFGGQLNSFLHVIPRNNPEFGENTQVWLQVSDSHDHMLNWPPVAEPVHMKVYEAGTLAAESDFDSYYFGFPRWFALDSTTTCELTVPGGSFGTMGIRDTLFAPWNLYATSGAASAHFTVFGPAQCDPGTLRMLDFMETYRDALEPLAWGAIADPVQYVVDVNGAGMPGEVVPLKVPVNVHQYCDPRDPQSLFFPGHEMGHVRLLHPSCGRTLQVPFQEYGESYATLVCLTGFEGLVPPSVLASEWGAHDLVFRHLALGTPVADVNDRTETLQWVEAYILRHWGWDVHRRIMFEYTAELGTMRQALLDAGFSDWEALPVLYSRLAGENENLGWLWEMAELGVGPGRVAEGLAVIATLGVPGAPPATTARMSAPWPNPATRSVTLRLVLPAAADARVEVFDVSGRRVTTLAAGPQPAGERALRWDLRDAAGSACAPGLYFCRLRAGAGSQERRIVIGR